MNLPVRADQLSRINRPLAAEVRAPSATSICCQKPPKARPLLAASASRRNFSLATPSLLGPVPVVKTIALLKLPTFET